MFKTYIKRPTYIQKITSYLDKDIIKVLTGQRRVGKSYLMFQMMDVIRNRHPKANIIYINKELHEFDDIMTSKDLLHYVAEKTPRREKRSYLFIDEVQDIDGFEKALRSLKAGGSYDIYCTGSNARLLSGELATYLSGRHVEIRVFGLSYSEFLAFHKLADSAESFFKYIKFGGLPYLIHVDLEDDIVYDYLRNVYDTILFKDVIKRFNVRNVNFLERLVDYLADNTGSLVSAKKISDFLKSQRINISPTVVLDYISHLTSSFLLSEVKRSDVRGKKIFEVNEKYYFEDLGLRHSLVGYRQTDINKVLENVVYNHLVMAGYSVTVGQLGSKEVDFVCEKQSERLYVQVSYMITDENKDREFGNLLEIPDNYPKLVLSMDETTGTASFKGIQHHSIRTFIRSLI
jgi:predicted AAA+ superfamily ATPase